MAGPLSVLNGDERIVRGSVNEEFVCVLHGQKHLAWCNDTVAGLMSGEFDFPACRVVPLRYWLATRGRLITGKTDQKK
jgi:hypothetical protein